jgi:peptidoglycan/LPS O-acetylase OafA/YrhL
MTRLRVGEWLAALFGVGLLLVMTLLDWYGDANAWAAYDVLDLWLALCAVVALALVAAQATRRSPSVPVALGVIGLSVSLLGVLGVLWRLANEPGDDGVTTVAAGAWIGLGCVAGLVVACWLSMRQESVPGAPEAPVRVMPDPRHGSS